MRLFGENPESVKVADFASMGRFFIERLKTVFAGVAPHAMPLLNSRNNPMYLLCFAAGNKKGAGPAVQNRRLLAERRMMDHGDAQQY